MHLRPSSHHRILAGACLLAALALVGISVYLGNHYSLPVAGSYQYGVAPAQSAVIWFQEASVEPEFVEQLDLRSGQISRVSSDLFDMLRNSRGQRIVLRKQLEIFDDKSGQLLFSGQLPMEYPTLIGDHYLIQPGDGHFTFIDLDQAIKTGSTKQVTWPVPAIVPLNSANPIARMYKIEGTNRFLYHFQDDTNPNVTVFEIDAGQLRTVASWPTVGDSQVTQYNGTVLSASVNSAEVEVRSLNDFQLIKKLPLPKGMGNWGDVTSALQVNHDLFSFAEIRRATSACIAWMTFRWSQNWTCPSYQTAFKRYATMTSMHCCVTTGCECGG